MNKTLLFLFVFCSLKINAQKLSAEEKQIINEINKQMPQTLQLLEQLVNINSGTFNTTGVKNVGQVLRKEFDKIGFTTEWISLPDSLKLQGIWLLIQKEQEGKNYFSSVTWILFLNLTWNLTLIKN